MVADIVPVENMYGAVGEISLVDDKLLLAAEQNWSPVQMGKKYGMRPEDAVIRVKTLLASTDVWTALERKKLVISSIMRMKEKFDNFLDEMPHNNKMATTYVSILRLVAERLDREAQFTDEELTKVTDAQKKAIMAAVERGYYRVREFVKDYHPDVDLQELDAEFRKGLMEGFIESE